MALYTRQTLLAEAAKHRTVDFKSLPQVPGKRVFLSHSHDDAQYLDGAILEAVMKILVAMGYQVYVDWLDSDMQHATSHVTASKLKTKIDQCDRFVLVASHNAIKSRWVPWELGYADAKKGVPKIALFPIADPLGRWDGSEYLQLYPRIETGTLGPNVLDPTGAGTKSVKAWLP